MRNLEIKRLASLTAPKGMPPIKGQQFSIPGLPGAPSFPGQQFGATVEQVRSFIKQQKRVKGYTFDVDTGTTREDLQISGTARMFLGLAILIDPTIAVGGEPTSISLTINNEIIIDELPPEFLSPDFCDDEYYFIPRPLSGTDEIFMNIINPTFAQRLRVAVYYL
jgi:hypothetical protein